MISGLRDQGIKPNDVQWIQDAEQCSEVALSNGQYDWVFSALPFRHRRLPLRERQHVGEDLRMCYEVVCGNFEERILDL